jgi:hypothetical protein
MPNDTSTTPRIIVAVTGEDDRYSAVRSRATALAAGGNGTVILYDLDAGGLFASPVPTAWSGEGERELTDEEAGPRDRLDADELDTAGRATVADQVRQLRSMGVDAWGWLPTSKDAGNLVAYAERQGASLVLVPPDVDSEATRRSSVAFEVVG